MFQNTDHSNIAGELFRGKIVDRLMCPFCGEIRSCEEVFTSLSVDVKGVSSLEESIERYGAVEEIEGIFHHGGKRKTISARVVLPKSVSRKASRFALFPPSCSSTKNGSISTPFPSNALVFIPRSKHRCFWAPRFIGPFGTNWREFWCMRERSITVTICVTHEIPMANGIASMTKSCRWRENPISKLFWREIKYAMIGRFI